MTDTQALVRYREVTRSLEGHASSLWGFTAFSDDGVVLIGAPLSAFERMAITRTLPHFQTILFFSGVSKESYSRELRLRISNIFMCGGSLPGCKWAYRGGEWKDTFHQCFASMREAVMRVGAQALMVN